MGRAKKITRGIFFLFLVASVVIFGFIVYFSVTIPSSFTVVKGTEIRGIEGVRINSEHSKNILQVSASGVQNSGGYSVEFRLLGVIPVSSASVTEVDSDTVILLGKPFGIKVYADGVMVVGSGDVQSQSGNENPAARSDIRVGDIIVSINGVSVSSNSEVAEAVEQSGGAALKFVIKRNGKKLTKTVTPVYSQSDGAYKIGIWVRDSSAGIGTLTFYSPAVNTVAGLGHAICDSDTGEIIPLEYGVLEDAEILGVSKSENGNPGELEGCFKGKTLGEFTLNCNTGVYGVLTDPSIVDGIDVKVADKSEIKKGKAEILTTLSGEDPELYECEIERVETGDTGKIKNMTVRVTDQRLLSVTGGIVRGMSGSPIIQNGKFIGAVTHVFVDDPERGYAVFAENMLSSAQAASLKKAS